MKVPRSLLIALALVAAASVGTWLVSRSQHEKARTAAADITGTGDITEAAFAEQLALERFQESRHTSAEVATIEQANTKLEDAANREQADATPAERALLASERALQAKWLLGALAVIEAANSGAVSPSLEPERALLHSFLQGTERLSDVQVAGSRIAQGDATELALFLMLGTLLLLGGVAGTALLRDRKWQREVQFDELLAGARDEDEAHSVLKRHLELALRGVRATILAANNSANRLEARTRLDPNLGLGARLDGAAPDSCLAMRLARPHMRRPGAEGLAPCELCGAVNRPTLCAPLVVAGNVIGSVLLARNRRFTAGVGRHLAEVLLLAAPAIANQRNLAVSERRAATDALTGLANRRAGDDALKREVALAGRTTNALALLMVDIDHFKQVNDTYGHDKGDHVLAAVAQTISARLRDSDFACRYGGEEFLVLLPATDRQGAVRLADELRVSVAGTLMPAGISSVTVSIGVAAMAEDGVEAEQLVRAADRAMYLAKHRGRNRVESSTSESDKLTVIPG